MSTVEYVVCDRCGNVQVQRLATDEKWECEVCGSDAGWLYIDRAKAFVRGLQISDEARSKR